MDPLRLLCDQNGFFTRGMARDVGYDDRAIAAMVRLRVWFRFRRGYYTFTDVWSALDEVQRHLVRCRAVQHSLGPAVALSHVSGVVARGIDTWDCRLDRVHVTRLDGGAGRVEGDVVHHVGVCSETAVVVVNGLRVLPVERCLIEYGSISSAESALVTFNSALHKRWCDNESLFQEFRQMGAWPGVRHLHIPVRMADPGPESVGETRAFWLFRQAGLPAPQPQFEVYDTDGKLRGTCDFGWPDLKTLGEFDGELKYGRLLQPGQQAGDVVFAEKRREDELCEITAFRMIRLVWTDYQRPRVTVARIQRMLRRSP